MLKQLWKAGPPAEEAHAVPVTNSKARHPCEMSHAPLKPFAAVAGAAGWCYLSTCRLVKPHCLVSSPIIWRALDWQELSSVSPCRAHDSHNVCQHILSLSAYADIYFSVFLSLSLSFFFFFLMYSSLGCRHLVNPFRTYQLCSSAHKPITSEALCSGTQVPDQCTKPNWVM